MSLDSRLRADLHEIAADVDPVGRGRPPLRPRRSGAPCAAAASCPRVLGAAACLALVGGLLAVWLTGRQGDDGFVVEPHPPSGTYEATLSGDPAGLWRLRFGGGRMSLVAPDTSVLGARAATRRTTSGAAS